MDKDNCVSRITNYLSSGGLFNPELMEHEKVSLLLQDSREAMQSLEDDLRQAMWAINSLRKLNISQVQRAIIEVALEKIKVK